MSSPHSLVFGTTLPKILIITTWINANVRGPTWHILSGLKTRESEGDKTLDCEGKFWQFLMRVALALILNMLGVVHVTNVLLSRIEESKQVSTI